MTGEDSDLPRVTRTLAEVAQTLAAGDAPESRIVAVLSLVKRVIPCDRCAILAMGRVGGRLALLASPEPPATERAAMVLRLTALLRLMSDEVEAGDSGAVPAEHRESGGARGTHLAVPVHGLDGVIGLLFVERAHGDKYGEDSLRLLSVIAAQVGAYLTSLRLREEEVERARQLGIALQKLEDTDRRKDEFLAMLGHELRNPLGAINSALRVLDKHAPEPTARYHQLIDRQIRHLSRIVDDLLDASRVRLGKIVLDCQPVDLNLVAARWLETFGSTALVRSHDVSVLTHPEPVVVNGDPVRLEQVFSNLLTNALKYTPAGGTIEVTVTANRAQGEIRVRDTGIGLAAEVLKTVFEPFTQADEGLDRSQGGLGLGLSLVRGLVEKHGGSVHAHSDGLGKGSEFVVRLPLAAFPTLAEEPKAPETGTGGVLSILVVEDNDDAREMMIEVLAMWGHHVEGARDGLQGVARAAAASFDAMFVDIGLPQLDGYQVARRVRQTLGERAPFLIAMTGYGQPEDRRRAGEAGFDVHMVKPIDARRLQEQLAAIQPRERG